MRSTALLLATLASAACGGGRRYVDTRIPPKLDLSRYGRAGLAVFTIEKAKGTLHQLATARFSEAILAAQPGFEVLEVGAQDSMLRRLGEPTVGARAAQAIGAAHKVPVVFAGHLKVSDVKPSGRILGLEMPSIKATVRVDLDVGLYSGETGGTLWRSSAWATEEVGSLSISGGIPDFSAKDPNAAYGRMINRLIELVTSDMWPTWQRQEVRRN
jgi:hypothetical protein